MRRGATREEIIRTTQDLIAQNGIRAVRVDEIAQTLGISKRTLYEMFADKTDLVSVCLDDMSRRQHQQIAAYEEIHSDTPLRQAGEFIVMYIDSLYAVDSCFLSEVRLRSDFVALFAEHRTFCHTELARILGRCQQQELLLSEVDVQNLSDRTLNTLLEFRLKDTSREESILFSRTMLRGTATRIGIDLIDTRS